MNPVKRLLESPDSFATSMVVWLIDRYGLEVLDWDPMSIKVELSRITDVPATNLDKIHAGILIITTNQFYVSLESFIAICNTLSGSGASFETYDPADVMEMCWGITEAFLLSDPDESKRDEIFSQEIRHYMGVIADHQGFTRLPKPLSFFAATTDSFEGVTTNMPDPTMYAAYWSTQQTKALNVEHTVKQRLQRLHQQIDLLPLQNIDRESWQRYLTKGS